MGQETAPLPVSWDYPMIGAMQGAGRHSTGWGI